MRALLLITSLLLTTACTIRQPIRHALWIEPQEDGSSITITVISELDGSTPRVNSARAEIIDGRDPWSVRFRLITPESERLILDRKQGVMNRAEHSAVVDRPQLQTFLADTGIAVHFTRGDRWTELDLYPPGNTRATRRQRERVEAVVREWSRDSRDYFRAMDHLYAYMNAHPHRAEFLFEHLLGGEGVATEEEAAIVATVSLAMERMVEHMEAAQSETLSIDEEFDLVYNPFPAEVIVRAPSSVEIIEGFVRRDEKTAAIPRRGIFDAIEALEGKWLSPDPLAILARSEQTGSEIPSARALASQPRHVAGTVTPAEIEEELVRFLVPATTFRLRWTD
jgi:hypothetical protein